MTPEYILRKSISCRPAHCSNDSAKRSLSEIEDMQYASEYAEPGYTQPRKGILFANWNYFSNDVVRVLEAYGYEIEWSDEWTRCEDCGKALRTSPDCYSWQPSYFVLDGSELCRECVPMEEYLESLEDNPRKAVNDHLDLAEFGYTQLQGGFENGLHPGMNDSPSKIFERFKNLGHKRLLFSIDEVSQFYSTFSIWEKVS